MRRPLKLCELDREGNTSQSGAVDMKPQLLLPLWRRLVDWLRSTRTKKNGGALQWVHQSVLSDPWKSGMPIVSAFECEIKGKKTRSSSLKPVLLSFRVRAYAEFRVIQAAAPWQKERTASPAQHPHHTVRYPAPSGARMRFLISEMELNDFKPWITNCPLRKSLIWCESYPMEQIRILRQHQSWTVGPCANLLCKDHFEASQRHKHGSNAVGGSGLNCSWSCVCSACILKFGVLQIGYGVWERTRKDYCYWYGKHQSDQLYLCVGGVRNKESKRNQRNSRLSMQIKQSISYVWYWKPQD